MLGMNSSFVYNNFHTYFVQAVKLHIPSYAIFCHKFLD